MECAFAILSLCLFDPAGVSVSSALSWRTGGDFVHMGFGGRRYNGSFGHLRIAVDVPQAHGISLSYGIDHWSYAEMRGERGEERAFIGLQWRPFVRDSF